MRRRRRRFHREEDEDEDASNEKDGQDNAGDQYDEEGAGECEAVFFGVDL